MALDRCYLKRWFEYFFSCCCLYIRVSYCDSFTSFNQIIYNKISEFNLITESFALLIIIIRAWKLHPMIFAPFCFFSQMPKPLACTLYHVSALHTLYDGVWAIYIWKKEIFLHFENRFLHRHYGWLLGPMLRLNWLHRRNIFTACKMLYDRWWRALEASNRNWRI